MKAWKWGFRECRFRNEAFGKKGIRNEISSLACSRIILPVEDMKELYI